MFNNEKSHNELLKTINATVNHELRNPLNSIAATNELKQRLYSQMKEVLDTHDISDSNLKEILLGILNELIENNEVNKASTKLILFLI